MNESNQNFSENLVIHFDVGKHQIPIEQSIITEQSIKIVIEDFNKIFFNGELDLEIFIHPEEEGGFIKNFLIATSFLAGIIGQSVLDAGVKVFGDGRNMEEHFIEMFTNIKTFLKEDSYDLKAKKFPTDKFCKSYNAKSNFYRACVDNPKIRGVGFDESHNFPVQRNQFAYRIIQFEKEDLEPIEVIHHLRVVSSINTKSDRSLAWTVKDKKVKKRFDVYMEDEEFYDSFLKKPFLIHDFIVKIYYELERDENGDIKFKKGGKRIIKVYECGKDKKYYSLPKDSKIEPAPLDLDILNGKVEHKKVKISEEKNIDSAKQPLFKF